MNRSIVVRAAAVLLLACAANASAQAQNSGQQRCLNKSSGSARKVTSSTIKNAVECLKRGSSGSLPMGLSAQDCLSADLKGKIAKARTKVDGQITKNCGASSTPDFGLTGATTINDAHEDESVAFVPDCFGSDLDATIAGPLSGDPKARCSSGALGQTVKVADSMLKVYLACVKSGLKSGSIVDEAGLAACLEDINTDAKGRVAKSVGRVESKLASSACPATPADLFPELDGAGELCDRYGLALPLTATTLADCLGKRMRCRVCRIASTSAGFDQNCDLFDDGSIDATCPECPNGLTDPGEQCDDGNTADGDGCTGECIDEFCGDGVVNDSGLEECDDGPSNSDSTPNACRTGCTLPVCGDAIVDDAYDEECDAGMATAECNADCTTSTCGDGVWNILDGEECDDGNTNDNDACVACQIAECGDGFVHTGFEDCDSTDCCTGFCAFAPMGTACTGTAGICSAPQCDGAGTCQESPANEGASCDDGNVCTVASSCQSGTCAADEYSGVGLACEWVVVGTPDNRTGMKALDFAVSDGGAWCAWHAEFNVNSVVSGDIVTSDDNNNNGRAILFGADVQVDGDIVANNFRVETLAAANLPGLTGVSVVGPGQHVNKTPAPTFYDTTGTDPRVAQCAAAQADIAATKAALNLLPTTQNLGAAYKDLPTGPAPAINAVNVGGVNVFDMTHLTGTASNTTITLNGGGNSNTVFVLRISNRLNTAPNWTFNLIGGLSYDHLLFYVTNTSGDENCAIGIGNVGGGTLFCPDLKIHVLGDTVWSGAAYGGAGGLNGEIRIGQAATLTYVPFTGDVD